MLVGNYGCPGLLRASLCYKARVTCQLLAPLSCTLGRWKRWLADDPWCIVSGERRNAVLPTMWNTVIWVFTPHPLPVGSAALDLQCLPELWLCLFPAQPQLCLCLAKGPVGLNWNPWTDLTLDLTCHHRPVPEATGLCLALATPQDLIWLPSWTSDLPHHPKIASWSPFWTWPPSLALAWLEDNGTCHLPGETLPCQLCYQPQLLVHCAKRPEPCYFLTQWWLLLIKFPLCGYNYLDRCYITPNWSLLPYNVLLLYCRIWTKRSNKRHSTGVDKSQLFIHASWSTIVPFEQCNHCSFLSQQELVLFLHLVSKLACGGAWVPSVTFKKAEVPQLCAPS